MMFEIVCAETMGSPKVVLPALSSLAVSDIGMTGFSGSIYQAVVGTHFPGDARCSWE